MKKYLKNNSNNIIGIFLIISPILDLMTGLNLHSFSFPLTIGMIIRMLFLLLIFIITYFCFNKKKVIIPYIIVGIFSLFFITGMFIYNEEEFLLKEIQNLIKTFYFPLLFSSLFFIRKDIKISNLTLFTTLFLYLVLLFIPVSLGIGYKSYEITKVGTLGFFNSANEISGIISILIPILFIILKESKKKLPMLLLLVIYLVVILMIGTKTPLLAFCFVICFVIIYHWLKWLKSREIKKVLLSLMIIIISIISLSIIIPKTNFYKNIKTHLKFLGVNNVVDVLKKSELIDHFIFSQRLSFLHQKAEIYRNSNTYQKLFGIGAYQNDLELKAIEMDYFDIYYNYGIIGFFIFFGITLPLLYKILIEEKEVSFERYMLRLSLALIIILSFFTGHILVSPAVSFIVSIIILSLNDERKKRIFIAGENINPKQQKFINKIKIEDNSVTILIQETPRNNSQLLLFKVLNYNNYDISIYLDNKKEIGKEESRIASNNRAIFTKKDNSTINEYNWIIFEEKQKKNKENYLYYKDNINFSEMK